MLLVDPIMANNYDNYIIIPLLLTHMHGSGVGSVIIHNASMHANESTQFMKSPEFLVATFLGLQQKNEAVNNLDLRLMIMHDCMGLNFN